MPPVVVAAQDPPQRGARIETCASMAGALWNDQGVGSPVINPTHLEVLAAVAHGGDKPVVLEQRDGVADELGGAVHDAPPAWSSFSTSMIDTSISTRLTSRSCICSSIAASSRWRRAM